MRNQQISIYNKSTVRQSLNHKHSCPTTTLTKWRPRKNVIFLTFNSKMAIGKAQHQGDHLFDGRIENPFWTILLVHMPYCRCSPVVCTCMLYFGVSMLYCSVHMLYCMCTTLFLQIPWEPFLDHFWMVCACLPLVVWMLPLCMHHATGTVFGLFCKLAKLDQPLGYAVAQTKYTRDIAKKCFSTESFATSKDWCQANVYTYFHSEIWVPWEAFLERSACLCLHHSELHTTYIHIFALLGTDVCFLKHVCFA